MYNVVDRIYPHEILEFSTIKNDILKLNYNLT